MSTNRLAKSQSPVLAVPAEKKEREKFWIERGNRILWGQEATAKHGFLEPRRGLHWVCVNGHYLIEPIS